MISFFRKRKQGKPKSEAPASTDQAAPIEAAAGEALTILVVDDSPTEVHVLRKILEPHGYKVEVASDGQQGVDVAKNIKPDLILMDVVMPNLNGFQATRKLSKNEGTADIPVIMVTTKDQETDKNWAKRQGAIDYVVKPVSASELMSKIKGALSG